MPQSDSVFAGSVPALYDRHLGPMLFAPYAADMARRLSGLNAGAMLETACGTGIVTRALRAALPQAVRLVATDLNQAMLDHAARGGGVGIEWQQANALSLPFADASFDAVVCQFGVMFFPDRVAGFREALRVLRPAGRFVFNAWGPIADSPIANLAHATVAGLFPADPPGFLARTPHGYADPARIRADVEAAGFRHCTVETVVLPCRAATPRDAAVGYCQGTPLRGEIEARDATRLGAVTDAVASAYAARYGAGPIEDSMMALVVTAEH
jgi:ubiquinone/menaquinone biosynthesis C-methylase UbiE